MRKFVRGLLCLAIIGACLTGCSKSEGEQGGEVSSTAVTVYLTRHGETEYNVKKLAQGWCDSPLTENGIAQAQSLTKGLADIEFAAVYSSDSGRAVDTANLVMEGRGLEVKTDERLREMNFGSLEEAKGRELWEPSMDYRWEKGWVDEGGEDWEMLADRMNECIMEIVENPEYAGKNVFISTHGMSITSFMYYVDAEVADNLPELENCGITAVSYDNGEWSLITVNDISYLK